MATTIRFFGVAGFEIVCDGHRVLVDPFLKENPSAPIQAGDVQPPDVILVSHAAPDHLGDAAQLSVRTGAPVVCGSDVKALLLEQGVPEEQIRATIWGVEVEVGGLHVIPVESHHWSHGLLRGGMPISGIPMGFVFETEPGVRIYHYGDSALFDLRLIAELYSPTVALLGCSLPHEVVEPLVGAGRLLTGEMTPAHAARAVEMLGVQTALACHYLAPDSAAEEFVRLVGESGRVPTPVAYAPKCGESIVLEASTDGLVERKDREGVV